MPIVDDILALFFSAEELPITARPYRRLSMHFRLLSLPKRREPPITLLSQLCCTISDTYLTARMKTWPVMASMAIMRRPAICG